VTYAIEILPAARKELSRLGEEDKRRVDQAILRLASVPRPAGAKLLVGLKRLWRLRVGDIRIVYRVIDNVMLVVVIKIGHRREVYRRR
jgi:mRNA interferase RelE/StbE